MKEFADKREFARRKKPREKEFLPCHSLVYKRTVKECRHYLGSRKKQEKNHGLFMITIDKPTES